MNDISSVPDNATSKKKHHPILLWLVAIGFFMETLDSTIVNTALPSMAKSLGESPLKMQSVIIAYSLTIAVFIPASGWIADRFGTKKVFMTAIVLFTCGSLACSLSQNLLELVVSRVLQGAGGSMLLPIGRLAVLRAFPGAAFLEAISFVTIPGLIGPLLGPTLGGWLVEYASWHWIFLINIPIGVIGVIATSIAMPDSARIARAKFDIAGFLQLSLAMVSISYALDGLAELGLSHAMVLVLMIFGLACLTAYILRAVRMPAPLFPLVLFRVHTFSIGLLGNLFARIGSSAMPFLIPLLLQVSLNYSPFQAGMMMIPVAVAGILSKRLATPLIQWAGYRKILVGNTVLVGAAMASFIWITPTQPLWIRLIQLVIFGGVNSLQFSAMNSLALKDLDVGFASSGNSLFSMVQMLAMSFAVATAGALLNTFMTRFNGTADHDMQLMAFHATFFCMGVITCTSAWIFWQLSPDVSPTVSKKKNTHLMEG